MSESRGYRDAKVVEINIGSNDMTYPCFIQLNLIDSCVCLSDSFQTDWFPVEHSFRASTVQHLKKHTYIYATYIAYFGTL